MYLQESLQHSKHTTIGVSYHFPFWISDTAEMQCERNGHPSSPIFRSKKRREIILNVFYLTKDIPNRNQFVNSYPLNHRYEVMTIYDLVLGLGNRECVVSTRSTS